MNKQDLIKDIRKLLNQKKQILDKRTFNSYNDKISNNIFIKNAKIKTLQNINAELLEYTNLINTKKKLDEERIRKIEEQRIRKNVKFVDMSDYKGRGKLIILIQTLREFKGQDVVINIEYNNNIETLNLYIPSEKYNNWWKKEGSWYFFEGSDSFKYNNAKMYFYGENLNITYKKIKQVFQDSNNGLCFFNPIREWADNKLTEVKTQRSKERYEDILKKLNKYENIYKNGVDEDNIHILCNDLQIDVSISSPLTENTFINCKSNTKGLKHFKFINNRINHIELNEFLKDDEPIYITNEEMNNLKIQLKNDKIYHVFTRYDDQITSIKTLEKNYKLKNEKYEIYSNFEIETDLINCKVDDITQPELSKFINNGTHYNSTVDFKYVDDYNINDVFHIDMRKAYASFNLCEFYEGFLGKITDFRKTDKIEEVGLYYIYDLVIPKNHKFYEYNEKMKIYFSNNIYTSPELKFLSSIGSTYKISCGCWGIEPKKFNFTNEMLDKKLYAFWTGFSDMHNLKSKITIDGNEDLYDIIKSNNEDKEIRINTLNEITVYYNKEHNYHLGHITAFITAYQRLNVIEQLLNIDYDNIIRICVDGIYTINEIKNLKNSFQPKNDIEDKTFENIAGEFYISNIINYQEKTFKFVDEIDNYNKYELPSNIGEFRENNKRIFFNGCGGSGKTHINLLDKGLINPLYIAPSWKLSRNKQQEYNCHSTVFARVCTDDIEKINYIKRFSNVLIFDECSMINEKQKQYIFNTYKEHKLIFCGDFCQLPPYEEEQMNSNGFDKIVKFNKNYRCKDENLDLILEKLRNMIEENELTTEEINSYVIDKLKDNIINLDKLKEIYKIEDMILTGTKKSRIEYTEYFKDLKKYYVLNTSRTHSNGDIIISDIQPPSSEIRHAYTVHSIQGETAQNKLFIDMSKMWDNTMIYTALSRAKYLNQIYLII